MKGIHILAGCWMEATHSTLPCVTLQPVTYRSNEAGERVYKQDGSHSLLKPNHRSNTHLMLPYCVGSMLLIHMEGSAKAVNIRRWESLPIKDTAYHKEEENKIEGTEIVHSIL